jgi:hypothetical protein
VTAAIALGNPSPRLAGTRQGCATPRPAAAPLTEPAQPRRKHLYEGDARLALVHCEAPTTNILVDELWGQVPINFNVCENKLTQVGAVVPSSVALNW